MTKRALLLMAVASVAMIFGACSSTGSSPSAATSVPSAAASAPAADAGVCADAEAVKSSLRNSRLSI